MQLTPETQNLLQSFAKINNSIIIKSGDTLSTISNSKAVLAKAKLNQEFPSQLSIYDLSKFLSVLSLFQEPDLDIKEKFAVISAGDKKLNFTFSDESLITQPPAKDIKFPDPEVKVDLSQETISDILKAQGVLRLPELGLVGDGKKVYLQALDSKNSSADAFSIEVGSTKLKFKVIFKAENIRLLSDNYEVSVTSKGLSHWKGERVEYYIAIEANSTFSK
jgi:hypothetical protein